MRPAVLLLALPFLSLFVGLMGENSSPPAQNTRPALLPSTGAATRALPEPPAARSSEAPSASPADTVLVRRDDLLEALELEGSFVPVGAVELRCELTSGQHELTLAELLPHGAYLNEGDLVARLHDSKLADRIGAAERKLEGGRRAQDALAARARLAREQETFELAAAERLLARKQRDHEHFSEFKEELQERALDLAAQRMAHLIEDQEDELRQLEAMYAEDELVEATEEIVLRRSRRDLAQARAQQKLSQEQRTYSERHERQDAAEDLQLAAEQAAMALAHLQVEQGLAEREREAQLAEGRRQLSEAEVALLELRSDREALTLRSDRNGVLLHGGRADWRVGRQRPEYSIGGRITAGGGLFLIAPADRFEVLLRLTPEQVPRARSAVRVRVTPSTGGPSRDARLSVDSHPRPDGDFNGSLSFEGPLVGVVAGLRARVSVEARLSEGVLLLPTAAVRQDESGPWCLVVIEPGDDYRPVRLVLGASRGDLVVVETGLEEGDRVRLKETD